jgi:hypothetical protein
LTNDSPWIYVCPVYSGKCACGAPDWGAPRDSISEKVTIAKNKGLVDLSAYGIAIFAFVALEFTDVCSAIGTCNNYEQYIVDVIGFLH